MKARRQRIVRQRGEAKIEFSSSFAKDKNPNWGSKIIAKDCEPRAKKKVDNNSLWAKFQEFAAAELK